MDRIMRIVGTVGIWVTLICSSSASVCSSVTLTLGGSCSVLSTHGFRLSAPSESCLTYGGHSFDGNTIGAGSVTPENVGL